MQTIDYRSVTFVEDLKVIVQFQLEVWGVDSVTSLPQLVAAIHNGGMVCGAYEKEKLVGFCYGFPGYNNFENTLVSHMMAIHPDYRNKQIGEKLKFLQRNWAKNYGYKKIVWTYDPLESRNGYLNLRKLGAFVRTYYCSYYGVMSDELNKGLPSDRFLVEWDVSNENESKRDQVELNSITRLVDFVVETQIVKPVIYEISLEKDVYAIAVPSAIHEIKQADISVALEWRYALREAFTKSFEQGYIATDIIKGHGNSINYYIIKNSLAEVGND